MSAAPLPPCPGGHVCHPDEGELCRVCAAIDALADACPETEPGLVHLALRGVGTTCCGEPLTGRDLTDDRRYVTCPTCRTTSSAGPGWTPPMVNAEGRRVREAIPPGGSDAR